MFKVEASSFKNAKEMINALMLPANVKRRLLSRIGRMVIAQAQKNVREQKTVNGLPMIPRKRNRKGKIKKTGPMFPKLTKSKSIRVVFSDEFVARVGFTRNTGYVAGKHHRGSDEIWKMDRKKELYPHSDWYKRCNAAQAKHLKKCGYEMSELQITRRVTVGDAINWLNAHPDSWVIRVARRPILGASEEAQKLWAEALMGDIRERFRAKSYADLLT